MKVTDTIRRAVQECGETRYRISKETGVPQATLSRLVAGEREPSGALIDTLAAYFGLELRPADSRPAPRKRAAKSATMKGGK
ncbi:MAG: helix-turn-helix domain-containing protein [Phycisphaerales bacterium]